MKYELPKYSILTKISICDINSDDFDDLEEYYDALGKFVEEEQNNQLKIFGYENNDEDMHLIHYFNTAFRDEYYAEMTIHETIQCLAIKEGYDLVAFENGQKGYISYYGSDIDGFEIIC